MKEKKSVRAWIPVVCQKGKKMFDKWKEPVALLFGDICDLKDKLDKRSNSDT